MVQTHIGSWRNLAGVDAKYSRSAVLIRREDLVESLLALIVPAERPGAGASPANSVDLVDEDDGGGDLAGLGEQFAHAARANAVLPVPGSPERSTPLGATGRPPAVWFDFDKHVTGRLRCQAKFMLRFNGRLSFAGWSFATLRPGFAHSSERAV